jgi:hypothetical protein
VNRDSSARRSSAAPAIHVAPENGMGSDLARFLEQVVLDDGLRARVLAGAPDAFDGFDLTADEREILARRGRGVLALLGRATRERLGHEVAVPTASDVRGQVVPMPEIALVVRVQPTATLVDGRLDVRFTASLSPLPGTSR